MNFRFGKAEWNLFQRIAERLKVGKYPLEMRVRFWRDFKDYRRAKKIMPRRAAVMGLPEGGLMKKVLKKIYYYQ